MTTEEAPARARRVAVVGAGAAGLCTAKVLLRAGHDVTVFEQAADVGGVWSASRRYPGVTTQSPRDTYCFSDYPMPRTYPEWPTGEQVQEYFAGYAAHFGVDRACRLGTSVESAVPRPEGGWTITSREQATARTTTEAYDALVVANGVFSRPLIPDYPGREEFEAAGGRVSAATDVHDVEQTRGKDVVVLGYGKTACDVAVAVLDSSASVSVVARQMLWKVPRKVGGVVNFKYLLLTRMGEALFRYQYLRGMERFLHGPGNPIRRNMINSVGSAFMKQYQVERLGLAPAGTMEDIVKGAIGLVTDGFYEAVADERIIVRRDRSVSRLLVDDGRPAAELSDGTVIPADLVIAATGFTQGVPFLEDDVMGRVLDDRGNFALYRQVLPVDVPDLYFAGYNSSFFSPLNAEIAAVWIAGHLAGRFDVPDVEGRRAAVADRLAFLDIAVGGHHSHGTKIIPFSLHNIDELLGDLGANIGRGVRAWHWLMPVQPSAYRRLTDRLTRDGAVTAGTESHQGIEAVADVVRLDPGTPAVADIEAVG